MFHFAVLNSLMILVVVPVIGNGQVVQTGPGARDLPAEVRRDLDKKHKEAGKNALFVKELIDKGKYAQAIVLCEEAIADLDILSLRRLLTEALLRAGKDAEVLEKLLRLNEMRSDEGSYARIGLVLVRLGAFSESRARFSSDLIGRYYRGAPGHLAAIPTVRTNSGLSGAWPLTIGIIEDIHANDEDALYYFRIAHKHIPENALLNMRMGKILLRQRLLSEAKDCFAKAAKFGTLELKRNAEREVATIENRMRKGTG